MRSIDGKALKLRNKSCARLKFLYSWFYNTHLGELVKWRAKTTNFSSLILSWKKISWNILKNSQKTWTSQSGSDNKDNLIPIKFDTFFIRVSIKKVKLTSIPLWLFANAKLHFSLWLRSIIFSPITNRILLKQIDCVTLETIKVQTKSDWGWSHFNLVALEAQDS